MDVGQLYLHRQREPTPQSREPVLQDDRAEIMAKVLSGLAELGHPGRIAGYLAEQGTNGVRADPWKCVVANYLRTMTGIEKVFVTRAGTSLPSGRIEHPVEIRAFLWRFDAGDFPELECSEADEGT